MTMVQEASQRGKLRRQSLQRLSVNIIGKQQVNDQNTGKTNSKSLFYQLKIREKSSKSHIGSRSSKFLLQNQNYQVARVAESSLDQNPSWHAF